jgi:hypothetical protein
VGYDLFMPIPKTRLLPKRNLKPLRAFDVSLIQRRLDGVLLNVDRDLQRRIAQAGAARNYDLVRDLTLMNTMIRIASNSYAAICFLMVEEEDSRRRRNFALVIPPVNRQLMDLLFTLVYIRDDFDARCPVYERAGYRAAKEEYQLYRSKYLGLSEWKPFFADQKVVVREIGKALKITLAQKRNLKRIPRWKGPFKLSKEKTASQSFLRWMEKWLYGDTSSEAHLTGIGLFCVSPFLLAELADEELKQQITSRALLQYQAKHFSRTVMTVLAIATEIDAQFKLNNHTAIAYIWRILIEYAPDAKDMWEERYKAMLT